VTLLGATALALLLATPVWLAMVSGNPTTSDSFVRVFGQFTHWPDLGRSWFLVGLLFITCISRNTWPNRWFWISVWVGLLLALNQQVITGKINQPGKFMGLYLEVLIIPFALDFLLAQRGGEKRVRVILGIAAVTISSLGIAQNVYKLSEGARQGQSYNQADVNFSEVVKTLDAPHYREYGFLTNDAYLSAILPAYLRQKPLLPWYMDPLSNDELNALKFAAAKLLGYSRWSEYAFDTGSGGGSDIALQTQPRISEPVILILNKRRPVRLLNDISIDPVLNNADFIVVLKKPTKTP
jgi:hypothetical protein